jgi:Ca2+-transporting ATPase
MSTAYEKLTVADTLKYLETDESDGLPEEEAGVRLEKYGKNTLVQKKAQSKIIKLLLQFNDSLIYILLAATAVSLTLREYTDSVIILTVVVLNGIIGYLQQAKAEKAIEALKKLASPRAIVKRGGRVRDIDASELVLGDIVLLEAGRHVPADLRLILTSNLKMEESALTGESVPVEKDCDFLAVQDEPLGNMVNMAFMSTIVTYGRGAGVVTATGMNTRIGDIAKMLEETGEHMTPLQKRLADLGKLLGVLTVGICALLFVVAVIQRRNVVDMLLTAISLSVAAIPEGLPAIVTIVLAAGVSKMVHSHTIVRRLPAVETLGAVNIICTDKTGTLTQNRMTVTDCLVGASLQKPQDVPKDLADKFFQGFVLCNDASIEGEEKIGDPTETALLDLGAKHGYVRSQLEQIYPRVDEIPFDSVRKMMTTVHAWGDTRRIITKGALGSILAVTDRIYTTDGIRPIDERDINRITVAASNMASQALRVLALACKQADDRPEEDSLVFLGLEGMIDPPRPEAKEAVASCKMAGITTVMITGDHKDTAFAIAKELGIAASYDEVISGEAIDRMTQEELNAAVRRLRVFARVSPENKVAIVRAFKSGENIVSMTGDGVNDAPSLKSADIGIAMGITGTDVAKGAADMILTDDNFATIRVAIEAGRNIYNNIRKSVLFLLSSNIGEIITMVAAILAGMSSPLSPVQILWVNLVTDSAPALALGMDTGNPDIMQEKPRSPKESLFAHGGVATLIIYGLLIGGVTLTGFMLGYRQGGLREGRTIALTVLALSQLFHAVGMRNVNRSVFRMNHLENCFMIVAFFAGLILQIGIVQLPFIGRIFGTQQLSVGEWLFALLLSVTPLVMHEIIILIKYAASRPGPDDTRHKQA